MKIVHISYNCARPAYSDPGLFLEFLSFFVGIFEALSGFAEVIVIQHIDYKGTVSRNGVSYHFLGLMKWQLLLPVTLNAYIRRLDPDVVFIHGLIFPWQVLILRLQLRRRTRIIAQHHAERPLRHVRKVFQRWVDAHIDAYLFASLDLGIQWVKKGLIRNERKLKVVMEASSKFSPMERETARKVTGVSGAKSYLWVGRLDSNKDPLTVVKAFIPFIHSNLDVTLDMIYQTDELLDEVQSIISADPHASERIRLIGKIPHPQLPYWYNSVDFVVSGSHYEGSGVAVCEAMSCGCIPLLTDIPSFRMMTDNGKVGLLYPAGNEHALLEALYASLALNVAQQRQDVLTRFSEELSFDAIAEKIMSIVNDLRAPE